MKQRLLNSKDIVQTNETQNRFGNNVDISPLNITRSCGLIKDYKQLTDVKELFIEFSGLNEVNDNGKGTFKRIDNKVLSEDTGVILKINNRYYQRQYTGKVLLDWFNSDTIDTLLLAVKKYKQVKLSNKKYVFNITKSYNIEITDNFYIDGNQAEIEINSEEKLPYIFRLLFNAPIEYALFTNCKLKFNANTFVTSLRQSNCQTFDFYSENIFVDIDAEHISLTTGKILDGLPTNIQGQKTFINIPQKKEASENVEDTDFLSVKDLDTLAFVVNYVYAKNRTSQNVKGQKTFGEDGGCYLPLATEPDQYCNMQNLQNIIEYEMEEQLRVYTLAKAKEIGLEVSGNFPEGSVYIQVGDNKTPEELFGSADAIPWTNLSEYLQEQFGTNQTFYIRKNALRNNDALYIGKAKTAEFATEQSVNVMPMSLTQPEAPASTKFTLWYKGDCTQIPIKVNAAQNKVEYPDIEVPETPDTETPDTETPDTETPDTETPDTEGNIVTTFDMLPTHNPGTKSYTLTVSVSFDYLNEYCGGDLSNETIPLFVNNVEQSASIAVASTINFKFTIVEGSLVRINFITGSNYVEGINTSDDTVTFYRAEKGIIIFSMPSNNITINPIIG